MWFLPLSVVTVLVSYIAYKYWIFQQNYAKAKSSGLQVDPSPVYLGASISQILCIIWVPVFKALPRRWTHRFVDISDGNWTYTTGFTAFTRRNTDWITCATPYGIYMSIANAPAIAQICERRTDFPKPIEVYKILNGFGPTLVSIEGEHWRHQRKTVSPVFSERNNGLVWKESIRQTQAMLENWQQMPGNNESVMKVPNVQRSTTELALHIISSAAFGIKMFWSHEHDDADNKDPLAHIGSRKPPTGHDMTFKEALKTYLENVLWFAALSPSTLSRIPFKTPRKAYRAWKDLGKYWHEILDTKIEILRQGEQGDENLMSRLVLEAGFEGLPSSSGKQQLSRDEVVGNAWVFMFAGHETTANSIEYVLILLAAHLSSQRTLQQDIDRITARIPVCQWDYKTLCDTLYNSMLGASINEQMRLLPAVINLPKLCKPGAGDKTIVLGDNRTVVVPDGTFIHVNAFAVHRNAEYYPHEPSKRTGKAHDMDDFVPERWVKASPSSAQTSQTQKTDSSDTAMPSATALPTASSLYTPPRGSFIPFSDGQRACIGRRFAITELVAVLAVILSQYSVELATEQWATENEVESMTKEERSNLYQKAVDKAYFTLDFELQSLFTLRIPARKEVRLKFVRRGGERFG